MLPYTIGVVLGIFVAVLARGVGFDRDRSFYPTVMIVIAWYYVLFAVMVGSTRVIVTEGFVMVLFMSLAIIGYRSSLWIVAAALAAHAAFDWLHPHLFSNPGVPAWWPAFCATIDFVLAAAAAFQIRKRPATA